MLILRCFHKSGKYVPVGPGSASNISPCVLRTRFQIRAHFSRSLLSYITPRSEKSVTDTRMCLRDDTLLIEGERLYHKCSCKFGIKGMLVTMFTFVIRGFSVRTCRFVYFYQQDIHPRVDCFKTAT